MPEFVDAYDSATYWWRHLDEPICWLFARFPKHDSSEQVFAKIAHINRIYMTNVHRAVENAELKLAEHWVRSNIDELFSRLPPSDTRFSRENLPILLEVHEEMCQYSLHAIKRRTDSFSSKYLSFIATQLVPIYDSWAYASARRLAKASVTWKHYTGANRDYACHCECVLYLLDALVTAGKTNIDLKLVDYLLYADREKNVANQA